MLLLLFFSLLAYPFAGFLTRPFIVFFHELGHSIPALCYSKDAEVNLFVGSHGDEERSFSTRLGRLRIWVSRHPFNYEGLCRHDQALTIKQKITVVVCGPIASLVVAAVCLSLMYPFSYSATDLFAGLFFIGAIRDLFMNLGEKRVFTAENGETYYNDSYQFDQYILQLETQSEA